MLYEVITALTRPQNLRAFRQGPGVTASGRQEVAPAPVGGLAFFHRLRTGRQVGIDVGYDLGRCAAGKS